MPPPPPELIEPGRPGLNEPTPYASRPVRPLAQLAARVGLWTAVGFGCLGGLVGMLRPSESGADPVATESPTDVEIVPAPVAGMAERIVSEWMVATPDDEDRLAALFIDPPSLNEVTTHTLTLLDVTTVAGERLNDGYWTVTVAADVIETIPDDEESAGTEESATEGESGDPPATTWYVEIGIVGEVGRGLAGLTTPAIVPAPAAAESRWRLIPADAYRPDEGDQLATTIEGFLNALLAAGGDPARYLAPRVEMRAADPAPFAEVVIDELAAEELEGGDVRVWVDARGITTGGSIQVLSYEVVATERVDRWEIRELWGAPTVEPVPEGEPASPATSAPDEGEEAEEADETDGTSGTESSESSESSETGSEAGTGSESESGDSSDGDTGGSGDGDGDEAEEPATSGDGATETPVPEEGG
jgi:hypothetical protein